jgi:hypothetical protein
MVELDGKKQWYQRKFIPISFKGKPTEVLILGKDITEQKIGPEVNLLHIKQTVLA